MIIAASLLAANWSNLYNEACSVLDAGCNWLHLDVMDHHFVPNLTFGPQLAHDLRALGIKAHIDMHLMVDDVEHMLDLCGIGIIDSISIHAENVHLDRMLRKLKTLKCKIGLAFNPATPLTSLPYIANIIDYILIMTVNPGLGGQEFIPYTIEKIKEAKSLICKYNNKIKIQVDGGVGLHNIALLQASGVDIYVIGSHLFNTADRKNLIKKLRSLSVT